MTRRRLAHVRRAAAITVVVALAVLGLPRDWTASLATATASSCGTDTVLVYGPTKFIKTGSSSSWSYFYDTFNASPILGRRYVVEIVGSGVTQATVSINGVQYVGSSEGTTLKRFIDVTASNNLTVALKGSSGTSLSLRVVHVSEPHYLVYGERTFTRLGTPGPDTNSFMVDTSLAGSIFTLRIKNGNGDGTNRITNATVKVNGTQVASSSDFGSGVATVNKDVTIGPADTIEVNNQGTANSLMKVRLFATDRTPPVLSVAWPPSDTFYTDSSGTTIAGSVADTQSSATASVNGAGAYGPDGFTHGVTLSTDGWYTETIRAVNGACETTTVERRIARDTQAPSLSLSNPSTDITTDSASVTLAGSWLDLTRTVVTIDGDMVGVARSDSFRVTYALDMGQNGILFRARDTLGHITEFKRWVYRELSTDATARNPITAPTLSTTEVTPFPQSVVFLYKDTLGTTKVQEGIVRDSLALDRVAVVRGVVAVRDGVPLPDVVVRVLAHPEYGSTMTRKDGEYDLVVNGGGALMLRFTKPGFLESQRQVTPAILDYNSLDSVAMVGRSARVTVVDSAGTQPRIARGRFANDANGDRDVRMSFRAGTVAKVARGPGDTVSFSRFRVRATEFTIGGDGPEAMPGMLPPASAYTYCVDLRLEEADSLWADSLASKPAPSVSFTDSVRIYVKNFLHFPVGAYIPVGSYDEQEGRWKATTDGLVVKFTALSVDSAQLDVSGDGVAESGTALAAMGISGEERRQIAAQFTPGDSIWRASFSHFSPGDLNPGGPPAKELALSQKAAKPLARLLCQPSTLPGSIIECETRVLGEEIPIVGTPFALHYRSYRVPGDVAMRTLRIPVYASPRPEGLIRIITRVDVAGQTRKLEQGWPFSDSIVTVVWNGKDAFGRQVIGSVNAKISIGYQYARNYAKGSGGNSFDNAARSGPAMISGWGERAAGTISWRRQVVSLGSPSLESAGLGGWTITPHHFFDPNGPGALYFGDGSWLSGEQFRPMIWKHGGDGTAGTASIGSSALSGSITAADLAVAPNGDVIVAHSNSSQAALLRIGRDGVVRSIAGSGTGSYNQDGPALTRTFPSIRCVAVAPDGTIYFAIADRAASNTANHRLLALGADGNVRTVIAGPSTDGYAQGDGGPVSSARLSDIRGVAIGLDGSIYFSESFNSRVIRRIAPNGIVNRVAGQIATGGASAPGRADSLKLDDPGQIAIDGFGRIVFVDGVRVKQIVASGWLTELVGSASGFFPKDVSFGPDGGLYISSNQAGTSDVGLGRVYRMDEDGGLDIFAGGGSGPALPSEGQFAAGAEVAAAAALTLAPDGTMYVQNSPFGAENFLYRVKRTLGTRNGNEISVPSGDGSELYAFSSTGRHLYTKDALTGSTRFVFGYDAAGRLATIEDANGDVTTIQRNGSTGEPEHILGEFGHSTALSTDAHRYLATVTNPAGETISLAHGATGLLDSLTNAGGHLTQFFYDDDGRLKEDRDATGASQSLAVEYAGYNRQVTVTSDEGHETRYNVLERPSGSRRRAIEPEGMPATVSVDSTDGVVYGWEPDGSTRRATVRPDPRFGMFSALPRIDEVLPISGLVRWTREGRSTDTNFNPPDVQGEWRDTVTVNGRPWTTTFDSHPNSRLLTTVTPMGRTTTATVDSAGRPLTLAVPGFATVTNHYNARGRLDYTTQGSRTWSYAYDDSGRIESITDPLTHETRFRYDAADRLLVQLLPGGDSLRYGYEPRGNLAALKPPGKPAHAFAYTPVELTSRYDPPDVGGADTTHYAYNGDRQLTGIHRPDGVDVTLGYESGSGRLENITIPRGTVEFGYNSGTGTLHTLESPDAVTTTYTYDGPLPLTETWSGGVSGSVSVSYDNQFAVHTQKVNDGSEVTFAYDDDGLLTHADPTGGTFEVTRDASNGTITGTTLGNVTTHQYLSAYGEPDSLVANVSGVTLYRQVFGRDALGRITTLTELLPDSTHSYDYEYDVRGRLTQVTRDGALIQQLGYDGNGNRTSFTGASAADTASATYDAQDRLLRYMDTRYEYTAAGELQKKIERHYDPLLTLGPEPFWEHDTTWYSYDELGNLVGVGLPGGDSLQYLVDGQNRRVGKKLNGVLVQGWLYQNGLNPIAELDSSGDVVARYVYGTRGHVPDYVIKGGTAYRIVTDHLGSVRLVVNSASGAVAERRDYDAWGNVLHDNSPALLTLGYAGGIYDAATGLTRFGARDYDAGVGRWTGLESISSERLLGNRYEYAQDDPTNLVDPDGRLAINCELRPVFKRVLKYVTTLATVRARVASEFKKRGVRPEMINAYRHARAAEILSKELDPLTAALASVLGEFDSALDYARDRALGIEQTGLREFGEDTLTDLLNDRQGVLGHGPEEALRNGNLSRTPSQSFPRNASLFK